MLKIKVTTESEYNNEEEITIPKRKVFRALKMGVKKAECPFQRFQKRVILSIASLLFIGLGTFGLSTGYAQEILNKFPIVYDFYEDFSFFGKNKNEMNTFTLESEGDYQFLDKFGRGSGIYDVELIEGNLATFSANIIHKNQRYTGIFMEDTNWTTVTGEQAKLKWTPAKQEKIPLIDGTYTFENHLGSFQIGKEIEPGDYKVTVETDADIFKITVGTMDNVSKGVTEDTKYESRIRFFSEVGPFEEVMHLAKGSIFSISDCSHIHYEADAEPVVTKKNIKVTLTKIPHNTNTK